ncbi:flagellar hook-length control protein FliK [Lentisalinibacter sediminis]|uniref:flagellar hook-length control protein FliK n=1 Tax=Lentisalinibacter sediminis TaxID=2992237 RepID=UPI00386E77B5
MIENMLNMRPGEGFATGSGPVKLRAAAADPSAGTPFRIPALADPAAPGAPANGFRPDGNALPPGQAPDGTLRSPGNLIPADAGDPAALSTRPMLEQTAARLAGESGGISADTVGISHMSGAGIGGEAAAPAAEGDIEFESVPLPADLLPDLELEFPAAPLELRPAGLGLVMPTLNGSAAIVDGAPPVAGGMTPGSPGALPGQLHPVPSTFADPLSAFSAGSRMSEWSGALPAGSAGSGSPGLQGVQGLPGISGAVAAGDSAAHARAAAETLSAGLTALNGQSSGTPVMPAATPAIGMAGQASAPGLQVVPPGVEAMAGLRQAMADLARDGGGSSGDRGRPAPEALTRTDGAGFLSTLGLTAASQASAADRPTFMLPSPPGTPEFADQVAERVVWMAGQKLERAQIRLNPAHLGPIFVDVSVGEDGANITFTAQHAVTREALEQALPRLREMFSGSGLALAGADVSGQGPDTRRGGDDAGAAAGGETAPGSDVSGAADAEVVAETPVRSGPASRGLIDTYV